VGRGARKSNKRAKTSTLHLTPETPPETAIDTTPRCAPHRRRGGEEMMKPSTADAHTQKNATKRPSRGPPTPPQTAPLPETWGRRVSRSRPLQYDAPHGDESPNRTQRRQKKKPSNPQGAETHLRETQKSTRGKMQPTRLRAPAASPENLLQRYDFSLALYEPQPEFLCLPDGWGGPPTACRGLRRVCLRFCRTPSSQAL